MQPINPFPINFNTNERTPESQRLLDGTNGVVALLDGANPKRKQARLRQQTCALQPSLDCLTDNRSARVNLSDIEDALM